jgi:oxalate decarboxylase/phosphoglucose isomerase-like protein (cupin superfamily)
MTDRTSVPRYPQWDAVETLAFDWGYIKWVVSPEVSPAVGATVGTVIMLPGRGHERHNHPESDEVLYVISGTGEQMVEDENGVPIVKQVTTGDVMYIPRGVYHSTVNTGWDPMRVLAVYTPSGAEAGLRAVPDFRSVPAGVLPELSVLGGDGPDGGR